MRQSQAAAGERQRHNQRQGHKFDGLADVFLRPIAEDIQARTRRIVEDAALAAGSVVLDVGTGVGVLLPYLLETRPARLVACDLSAAMIAAARQRFGEHVQFVQSDVVDLPLTQGPFDAVFCNACFANFFDPILALQAIRERLRPGGRVIVSHPMGRAFVEQLRRESPDLELGALPDAGAAPALLEGAGLVVVSLIDEPNYYALTGRRE